MKIKFVLLAVLLGLCGGRWICAGFAQNSGASQWEGEWAWWNELANWDGQTPWQYYYTYSPRYFGPNAFPVPKMGDGKVPEKLIVDAAMEQYWGFGDNATNLNLRIDIPLYPKYVNLAVWMVPVEYYNTSIHVRNERLMRTKVPKGFAVGDVYIQTGIQILRDRPKAPDIMVNLCMKTAPGGPLTAARYFDTPGYFFDATIGKTFTFEKPKHLRSVTVSGRVGFLCWQSIRADQSMQDDAIIYGVRVGLTTNHWQYEVDFSGYQGWEHNGDCPMVLRAQVCRNFKKGNSLYFGGLLGFQDYKYYAVSIGYKFSYAINFFERKKK